MTKVIRNKEGKVINIGEWDHTYAPLPDGAYESEAEVLTGPDGGLYTVEDYQTLRVAEYPPIGDQLDALFKAGVFPKEMAAQLAAVKSKYPKPQ